MRWPFQPVEKQRRFAPSCCPHRDCSQHHLAPSHRFRYKRAGSYPRRDGSRVRRYLCLACGRTFSEQTFSVSYFSKRPELIPRVAAALVNGAAHRQIARMLGCAHSTVTRLAAKLGRHALLLQAYALLHLQNDTETTVLDHVEAFEGSQDDPFAVATLVGQSSWFLYGLDACTHPRTGRRSAFQEARRKLRPPRDPRGGYLGSAYRLLTTRLRSAPPDARLRVVCDGMDDYARAVSRPPLRGRIDLVVYPNPQRGPKGSPRSPEARARDAAMFPNDALHDLIRHSLAHHHRETIAFARRINAGLDRLFLLAVWRNFVKGVSERKPDPTTPAMRKGLTSTPWSWPRVFARRLFPDQLPVPESWMELYRREWTTPALASNARHALKLAF